MIFAIILACTPLPTYSLPFAVFNIVFLSGALSNAIIAINIKNRNTLFFVSFIVAALITSVSVNIMESSRVSQKRLMLPYDQPVVLEVEKLKDSVIDQSPDYFEVTEYKIGRAFGDNLIDANDIEQIHKRAIESGGNNVIIAYGSSKSLHNIKLAVNQIKNKKIKLVKQINTGNEIKNGTIEMMKFATKNGFSPVVVFDNFQQMLDSSNKHFFADSVYINKTKLNLGLYKSVAVKNPILINKEHISEEELGVLSKVMSTNTLTSIDEETAYYKGGGILSDFLNDDGAVFNFKKDALSNYDPDFRNQHSENFISKSKLNSLDRVQKVKIVCLTEVCKQNTPHDKLIDLSIYPFVNLDPVIKINSSAVDFISKIDADTIIFSVENSFHHQIYQRISHKLVELNNGVVVGLNTMPWANYTNTESLGGKTIDNDFLTGFVSNILSKPISNEFKLHGWSAIIFICTLSFLCGFFARFRIVKPLVATTCLLAFLYLYQSWYFRIDYSLLVDFYSISLQPSLFMLQALIVFSVFKYQWKKGLAWWAFGLLYLYITSSLPISASSLILDSAFVANCIFSLVNLNIERSQKSIGIKCGLSRPFCDNYGEEIFGKNLTLQTIKRISESGDIIIRSNHLVPEESLSSGVFDSYIVKRRCFESRFRACQMVASDTQMIGEDKSLYWVQPYIEFEKTGVATSISESSSVHIEYSIGQPEEVTEGEVSKVNMINRYEPKHGMEKILFKKMREIEIFYNSPILIEFGVLGGSLKILQVNIRVVQNTSEKTIDSILNSSKGKAVYNIELSTLSRSIVEAMYCHKFVFGTHRCYRLTHDHKWGEKSNLQSKKIIQLISNLIYLNGELSKGRKDDAYRLAKLCIYVAKRFIFLKDPRVDISNSDVKSLQRALISINKSMYENEWEVSDFKKVKGDLYITEKPEDIHHAVVVSIISMLKDYIEREGVDIDENMTLTANMYNLTPVGEIKNSNGHESIIVHGGNFNLRKITMDEVNEVNWEGDFSDRTLYCKNYPLVKAQEMWRFGAIISEFGSPLSHISNVAKFLGIPYKIES